MSWNTVVCSCTVDLTTPESCMYGHAHSFQTTALRREGEGGEGEQEVRDHSRGHLSLPHSTARRQSKLKKW